MTTNKAPIVKDLNIFTSSEEEKILLEPVTHFGKMSIINRTRELVETFNHWLDIPETITERVIEIVQLVHAAELIIDDMEENNTLRSGFLTSHKIYGISHTLGAIRAMYFTVMKEVVNLHPEGLKILTEQMLILKTGRGMHICWRDHHICPTEIEYKSMAEQKNGPVISLILNLMQLFSKRKENFQELVNILSLYFQTSDFLNSCDKRDLLGCLEYRRQILEDLNARAGREIIRLGDNPHLEKMLDTYKEIIISYDHKEATKANISLTTSEHSS